MFFHAFLYARSPCAARRDESMDKSAFASTINVYVLCTQIDIPIRGVTILFHMRAGTACIVDRREYAVCSSVDAALKRLAVSGNSIQGPPG